MTVHSEKTLLVVDDDDAFRSVLSMELRRRGYDVEQARDGREALEKFEAREPLVVLLDLRLPDLDGIDVLSAMRQRSQRAEIIILTGHGTIDTAIEAIRKGAFDYAAKPCPLDDLEMRVGRALERQTLRHRNTVLERGLRPNDPRRSLIGRSPEFQRVLDVAERVAPSDSTVLLLGETGVGKEMIAKLVHARSQRADGPFVIVECGALQESLLQSELFGHERGAFTGADRAKPGLFEVADGGTIFLDEIGEVNLATQVKLLRVLDTGQFRRVGGTRELKANVRFVAATNQQVRALVAQGLFREDFYYRLSTITIDIPPLRERGGDIDALVQHLLDLFGARFGVTRRVSPEARALINAYAWPGNVRELVHAIEGAMIVADGPEIEPRHLPAGLRCAATSPAPSAQPADDFRPLTLDEVEREHIARVLKHTHGKRAEAARILGVSERNLYRKLAEIEGG